jgi:lipopolysaccharide/colanic/teichoic acid biosynthesis glycosyltransferase
MKIIITGASGFVGKKLVQCLSEDGHELLLLGRNPNSLALLFPDEQVGAYPSPKLEEVAGFDACIHLATRNNDQQGTDDEFFHDNVEQLNAFCRVLKTAGVNRQIYISSILASADAASAYGRSKWKAEQLFNEWSDTDPDCVTTVLRPAFIHAKPFRGKLALLNKLPTCMGDIAITALSALRPMVEYQVFEDAIKANLNTENQNFDQVVPLSNRQIDNIFYNFGRWLLDMSFVLTVTMCFGWLLPFFWLWIRLDSPGPVFFIQERIGRNGRVFQCYKFRTMKEDTKAAATHEISRSSVTGVGEFLRKSKIDELPQIWNILRREMSLIGPRPCLPIQSELIEERQKRRVLDVLPGITGYAQIQNIDMSDPLRLATVDAEYIARRTLILDAQIVLQTFLGNGMKDYTAQKQ